MLGTDTPNIRGKVKVLVRRVQQTFPGGEKSPPFFVCSRLALQKAKHHVLADLKIGRYTARFSRWLCGSVADLGGAAVATAGARP